MFDLFWIFLPSYFYTISWTLQIIHKAWSYAVCMWYISKYWNRKYWNFGSETLKNNCYFIQVPSVSYYCLVETVSHPKTGKIDNKCGLPFQASTFSVLVERARQFSVQQCLQYRLFQENWLIFWPKVIVIKENWCILATK